jgi:hypothetical protein
MNWSPLFIIAFVTLFAAGLLIALVENWGRVAPVLSRWSWVPEGLLAFWLGHSAVQGFSSGDSFVGSLLALVAGMFGLFALTSIRRMRSRETGSS